jgi:hypothetical protein
MKTAIACVFVTVVIACLIAWWKVESERAAKEGAVAAGNLMLGIGNTLIQVGYIVDAERALSNVATNINGTNSAIAPPTTNLAINNSNIVMMLLLSNLDNQKPRSVPQPVRP